VPFQLIALKGTDHDLKRMPGNRGLSPVLSQSECQRRSPVGAAEGCDLLTLIFTWPTENQDQKTIKGDRPRFKANAGQSWSVPCFSPVFLSDPNLNDEGDPL
jgi:hypothetical protein